MAPGQREAALALGYSENQAFFDFILPQAVRHILPVYRGELVSLLKGTAVAGYISVQDLTKMSDIIRSRTYEALFPLIATALIYFLLAWSITLLLNVGMKRIDPRSKGGKKAMSLLKIEHLRKTFGDVTPIDDLSLEVEDGEVISVIGPSGTGKSTMLRCINRLVEPTSGTIVFDGETITDPGCDIYRVRQKMGMVFQQFNK